LLKAIVTSVVTLTVFLTLATAALAAPTLLSKGKATWATSQAAGRLAAAANDGSATTAWRAATRSIRAKWRVDLGAQMQLSKMTVLWPGRARFTYTIAGSVDGLHYSQLASGTGARLTKTSLVGAYRYVLVTITGSPTGSTAAIREARVFGSAVVGLPPPTGAIVIGGARGPQATSAAATTISNLVLSRGQSNVTYDNVTFVGGTSSSAVVTITHASNITFRNCTFSRGGGWNSVSVNDSGGSVKNIRFDNCRWLGAGRMNIEVTSRPTSAPVGYSNINITDSIFEPSGNEAVSYDGGAGAGNSLFQNNLIKGAGADPRQPWGSGLEINGPSSMVVKDNEIWQCREFAFNFQRHTTAASGWVVQNNVLDATKWAQRVLQAGNRQQVLCMAVNGGSFSGNRVVSAAPGGGAAYWSDSNGMDWRGTTWSDSRGGWYTIPMQVGCSGNQL
jgi:hypothetical protein